MKRPLVNNGRVDARVAAWPPSSAQSTKHTGVPSERRTKPADGSVYVLQAASTNRMKQPSTSTNGAALLTPEAHDITWRTDLSASTREKSSNTQPEDDAAPPITGVTLDSQEQAREVTDNDPGIYDATGTAAGDAGTTPTSTANKLGSDELATSITACRIIGPKPLAERGRRKIGAGPNAQLRNHRPRHRGGDTTS